MKTIHQVLATNDKKNPFVAISADGLNVAYGQTKKQALENLTKGIKARILSGN